MKNKKIICKKPTLHEIIMCNFNLSETEYLIFEKLLKSKIPLSIEEIRDKLGYERTNVQKTIGNLIKKNLIVRRQQNLERGYRYVYFVQDKKEILNSIEKNLNEHIKTLKRLFEKLL